MMVVDMKLTGRNIIDLRERVGLSVVDLQKIYGFGTPQAIYKWQRGETLPSVDNLVMLADVFGVTVDEILVCKKVG